MATAQQSLYKGISPEQWPIVYSPKYNISFLGMEKMHPFDSGKWGRVIGFLQEEKMLTKENSYVEPDEATTEDLLVVHTRSYLNSLKTSYNVAAITEVCPVALLPNPIVQRAVLRPFRYQTGGTVLAARLALDRGWAINVGGGFHHCSSDRGGGFCAYADITLAIKFLFARVPDRVSRAMIIDLDAHQGNGHERDFTKEPSVFILDVYNAGIYPHDGRAKRGIDECVELGHGTGDERYLPLVERAVTKSLDAFEPQFVLYNAGTDILEGDPLGALSITAGGIVRRDEIVFQAVRSRGLPIVMVTSGGYLRRTARIIADSVLNLRAKGLIGRDGGDGGKAASD